MLKKSFIFFLLFLCIRCIAQPKSADFREIYQKENKSKESSEYIYFRPEPLTFLKHLPGDIIDFGKVSFTKKNIPAISAIAGSTALLIIADQYLLDRGQELGDKLHLSHNSNQKTIFQLSVPIGDKHLNFPFNIPYDANTIMYFLGDGITHFSIAGGFWAYGALKDNPRARQTASELAESILATGICVQVLKHITGRESPYVSTAPRGVWKFFPNQVEYSNKVPHFDAFPSGHLATAMATVTVIAENYPEYKYIRPLGYSLMGLLSFAMVNNGVHWISDYPLALAMGYTFAKIAVVKGRSRVIKSPSHEEDEGIYEGRKIELSPVFYGSSNVGIGMRMRF